jgi:uncharacterized membrane protein YgaE (UPF0421/DUF939 family)
MLPLTLFINMNSITFFDYIEPLYNYLHSIRTIKEQGRKLVSFDIKLPLSWEVEGHLDEEEAITVKLQNANNEVNLYSFIKEFNADNVNMVFDRIIYILDKNIEQERKQELLNKYIEDLKSKVNEMSLSELEQLKISTNEEEHEPTANVGASSERDSA